MQAALLSTLLVFAFRRARPPLDRQEAHSGLPWQQWIWRLPLCSLVYLILFSIAGLMIWPFVGGFYHPSEVSLAEGAEPVIDQETLTSIWLFPLELVRVAGFALVTLPLLRSVPIRRLHSGLIAGVLLSVLPGLAPLLLLNQLMPAWVRAYHIFEIGCSNFVYGMVIAFLFIPKRP